MPEFLNYYGKLFEQSKIMERIMPRTVTHKELKDHFPYLFTDYNHKSFDTADVVGINKGLLEPIYDLIDRGGKRWRPCLGLAFAECFGRDATKLEDDIYYTCGLTEIVHNGSLMADDVEDKSLMRRGQPCTYIKYGVDYAINSGTMMYYIPIAKLPNFIPQPAKQLELSRIYHEEMVNLHFGQNWDISWHHGTLVPTEDQYVQMVINKTSVLPRICMRFISSILDLKPAQRAAVIKYIETLGAAFQIQDDIIAVISE